MHISNHYVMRDQVKSVIPELMKTDSRGDRRRENSFTELLLFCAAVALYLIALGLSN